MVTREKHTVLGKIGWRQDDKRVLKHVLLVLTAIKRAVFCWQCFSDLGLALIVYLRCLCQCRQLVGTAWSLL